MRINFTDNFDGYCQKCHDMLQEQTMEIDHTTTDKKREISQMKGSTNFGKYRNQIKPLVILDQYGLQILILGHKKSYNIVCILV